MPNYCFACAAETDKWKKISFVFLPVVGLYMGFVAVRHNSHGHHEYEQVRPTAYHPSPPDSARAAMRPSPAASPPLPPKPPPPPTTTTTLPPAVLALHARVDVHAPPLPRLHYTMDPSLCR